MPGPDDEGLWLETGGRGQLRLSNVGLSPSRHQPMASSSGRFVITYNGEIYNHAELRSQLEAARGEPEGDRPWHSDTWPLIATIEGCGLDSDLGIESLTLMASPLIGSEEEAPAAKHSDKSSQ